MIAYCGLDCQRCDAWIATRDNDDRKRQETARKWSEMYRTDIASGQIVCHGCKADGAKFFHCNQSVNDPPSRDDQFPIDENTLICLSRSAARAFR